MFLIVICMFIIVSIQGWLVFNGIPGAEQLDDIMYILADLFMILKVIYNHKKIKSSKFMSSIAKLFYIYLFVSLFLSLSRVLLVDYISIKGIFYELYKLFRNIPILLYGLYFAKDKYMNIYTKLYVYISSIASVMGICEYKFGLEFYKMVKLLPAFEIYPEFYNNYLAENRSVGLFQHPNSFGEFVSISVFILMYSIYFNKRIIRYKALEYIILLINLAGVMVSASRMAIILVFIILIFLSIIFKMYKIIKIMILGIVFTIPLISFAISKIMYKIWQYKYLGGVQGLKELRVAAWEQSYYILIHTGLLGSGLGTWGDASCKYSQSVQFVEKFGEQRIFSDAYLSHLFAENGVLLIIFIIILILIVYNTIIVCKKDEKNKYIYIITISIILFTVIASTKSLGFSLFENSFFIFLFIGYELRKIDNYKKRG